MSAKNKLPEKMQKEIVSLVEGGCSFRETARILGISDSTVRTYAASTDLDLGDPSKDILERLGRQVHRQQETLRQQRQQLKKAQERGYGYDDFIDGLRAMIELEKRNPFTYYPSKFAKLKSRAAVPPIDPEHAEIACLALSDWHLSETVRLRDSNGINVYNTVIGSNRLYDIVQRFKAIIAIHQAAYKIKRIWLPVIGDMVSGSIHPEFIVTNDMSDHAATLLGTRMLRMVIEELKPLDIPIQLDCVVGNHPRTTAKVPTKGIAHSNWDWQMYEFCKMWYADDDQIEFNVHTSQIAEVALFDFRYLVEHGIEWKNGREEDQEDNLRSLFDDPVYRSATGLKGPAFDQIVIGNLHKPAFLERTIKNGSLIGQNELGQQWRLAPIHAQQLMWGISRSHVRTFQYALDATTIRSDKSDNPYSEFAVNFCKQHGRLSLF